MSAYIKFTSHIFCNSLTSLSVGKITRVRNSFSELMPIAEFPMFFKNVEWILSAVFFLWAGSTHIYTNLYMFVRNSICEHFASIWRINSALGFISNKKPMPVFYLAAICICFAYTRPNIFFYAFRVKYFANKKSTSFLFLNFQILNFRRKSFNTDETALAAAAFKRNAAATRFCRSCSSLCVYLNGIENCGFCVCFDVSVDRKYCRLGNFFKHLQNIV